MTEDEVAALRKELDGIKVRGRAPPRPIRTWNQAGLYTRVADALSKSGFDAPLPIQAQALPVIMSGRDCIGIAKTGSGKTLAFVLPLLRHAKDQPPLEQGDGPIGLIMAPTRELVQQIAKVCSMCAICFVLCVCGREGMHLVAFHAHSHASLSPGLYSVSQPRPKTNT
jgi:ATP-dependent RNA helicase DDX46/PRP5